MQLSKVFQQLDIQPSTGALCSAKRDRISAVVYPAFLLLAYAYVLSSSNDFLDRHWINLGSDYYWTHAWVGKSWNVNLLLKIIAPIQALLFPILCIGPMSRARWLAILGILFFNLTTNFCYDESHSGHFLFWSAVFLCLAPSTSYGRWLGLRMAQTQVLMIYFLAGFWKFLALFDFSETAVGILQYTPYAIAQEFWQSNRFSFWRDIVMDNWFLSSVSGLSIVILQSGALVMMFFPRLLWLFGLFFIAFHLLTKISLGIYFSLPMPVIFVLFILPKFVENWTTSNEN